MVLPLLTSRRPWAASHTPGARAGVLTLRVDEQIANRKRTYAIQDSTNYRESPRLERRHSPAQDPDHE